MSAEWRPAGRVRRLVATGIDAVLVPALTILLVMVTNVAEDAEDYADAWWMAHVLGLAVLSYLLLNGYWLWRGGQTVGKRLLGVSIRDARQPDRVAPLWRLVLIRGWFFAAAFLVVVPWLTLLPLIDHLLIFLRHRRCLHDWLAGTVVMQRVEH